MDLLDDLRETRDAKLGVFPFDQAEALRRARQWQAAPPLERLRLQRSWTSEFREEYRQLRDAANHGSR
jgi:hypothetical protein